MISRVRVTWSIKFIKTESRIVVVRGWGKGEHGVGGSHLMGTEFQLIK